MELIIPQSSTENEYALFLSFSKQQFSSPDSYRHSSKYYKEYRDQELYGIWLNNNYDMVYYYNNFEGEINVYFFSDELIFI